MLIASASLRKTPNCWGSAGDEFGEFIGERNVGAGGHIRAERRDLRALEPLEQPAADDFADFLALELPPLLDEPRDELDPLFQHWPRSLGTFGIREVERELALRGLIHVHREEHGLGLQEREEGDDLLASSRLDQVGELLDAAHVGADRDVVVGRGRQGRGEWAIGFADKDLCEQIHADRLVAAGIGNEEQRAVVEERDMSHRPFEVEDAPRRQPPQLGPHLVGAERLQDRRLVVRLAR